VDIREDVMHPFENKGDYIILRDKVELFVQAREKRNGQQGVK